MLVKVEPKKKTALELEGSNVERISEHQFSRMMAGSSEGSPKVWREVLESLGLELMAVEKQ